jgi:hypothetical protein
VTGLEVVFLGASAVLTVVSWWAQRVKSRPYGGEADPGVPDDAAWSAARTLGLSIPFDRYWPATGRVEGVPIELEVVVESNVRLLQVRVTAPAPSELLLRREDRAAQLASDDLVVGEPRFDEVFRVQATAELTARALLDAATRDALAAAGVLGAGLQEGRFTLHAPMAGWTAAQVAKAARALVRAHHALRTRAAAIKGAPGAALNAIARTDRTAGVRLRALDHLLRAGLAERETLRGRSEDVDVGVRLLAAHALGAEGHPALEKLVRSGSRSVRVRAAGHLAESSQLSPEVAALVEDTFASALDDEELVRAALLGLTRRGSARSVAAVRAVADGHRSAEVRRLAEGVVAAIRARLDLGSAGGVSLAPEVGGDVALVDPAAAERAGEVAISAPSGAGR